MRKKKQICSKKNHHSKASGNEMKPETLQTVLNLIKAWMTARLNDWETVKAEPRRFRWLPATAQPLVYTSRYRQCFSQLLPAFCAGELIRPGCRRRWGDSPGWRWRWHSVNVHLKPSKHEGGTLLHPSQTVTRNYPKRSGRNLWRRELFGWSCWSVKLPLF